MIIYFDLCCFQTSLLLTKLPIWWYICITAQAQLAAEGQSSGKQLLANISVTLLLCPQQQTRDTLILFNSGVMQLHKAKILVLLRAVTLKWQAVLTECSGKRASGKLVWNHPWVFEMVHSLPVVWFQYYWFWS